MFNKTWKRNKYVCCSVVFLWALNVKIFHQVCSFRNDFETALMCWIKMDRTQFTGHENLMVWNRVGRMVISIARWMVNLRGHFNIILLRTEIKYNLIYCHKMILSVYVRMWMFSLKCISEANKCGQQERIILQRTNVSPQLNGITSKHKRISPQHNGIIPQHNWIFPAKLNFKFNEKWYITSPC